jgi:hypothetical protein
MNWKQGFLGAISLAAILVACPTPNTVKVTVSPKTATIKAGDSAIAFSATLENSSSAITWTLEPSSNSGTLNTTTGTTVNYTPPNTVTSIQNVTLRASVEGISDTASITVNLKPTQIVIPPTGTPISQTELNALPDTLQTNANVAFGNTRNDVNSFVNSFALPGVPLNPLKAGSLMALNSREAPTDIIQLLRSLGVPMGQGATLQATNETYTLLPTGLFDCTSGTCPSVPTGTSEDLTIKWKSGVKQGEVLLDWNGNTDGVASAPVKAYYGEYSPSAGNITRYFAQVPTKLRAKITYDGVVVLTAKADIAYAPKLDETGIVLLSPTCASSYCYAIGYGLISWLYETAKVSVDINNTNGTPFASFTYDLNTKAAGGPTLAMGMELLGTTTRKASLSAKLGGTISKDSAGYWTNFTFAGDSSFQGSVLIGSSLTALAFTANTINSQPVSINIPSGSMSHENKLVSFAGVLNDSNKNCILGENLTITHATGSTNLEQYLIGKGATAGSCP